MIYCDTFFVLLLTLQIGIINCINIARVDGNQDLIVYINGQPLLATGTISMTAYQQLWNVITAQGEIIPSSVRYERVGYAGRLRVLNQPGVFHMKIAVVRGAFGGSGGGIVGGIPNGIGIPTAPLGANLARATPPPTGGTLINSGGGSSSWINSNSSTPSSSVAPVEVTQSVVTQTTMVNTVVSTEATTETVTTETTIAEVTSEATTVSTDAVSQTDVSSDSTPELSSESTPAASDSSISPDASSV